ncbi:hypothetical protein MPSEU_000080000 [Mayamaea pseudoterrestris]|nr:hypothetical protein MPSEU_000080000 [Mayamaea pseudoterrestris]
MSSTPQAGGQRRRPNGGRGGGGGGRSNNRRSNNGRNRQQRTSTDSVDGSSPRGSSNYVNEDSAANNTGIRDEDILIAFMPFLRGDNPEAFRIHEAYQTTRDQATFIKAARALIEGQQQQQLGTALVNEPLSSPRYQPDVQELQMQQMRQQQLQHSQVANQGYSNQPHMTNLNPNISNNMHRLDPSSLFGDAPLPSFLAPDRVESPIPIQQQQPMITSPNTLAANLKNMSINTNNSINNNESMAAMQSIWGASPITPPRTNKPIAVAGGSANAGDRKPGSSGSWAAAAATSSSSDDFLAHSFLNQPRNISDSERNFLTQVGGGSAPSAMHLDPIHMPPNTAGSMLDQQGRPGSHPSNKSAATVPATPMAEATTPARGSKVASISLHPTTPTHAKSPEQQLRKTPAKPQPTRLWTHFKEQPGRIIVNGWDGHDPTFVLKFRPREELFAHWSLPIKYLQQARPAKSLDNALKNLAVGLFRRGCSENATQASIISKFVTERSDYGIDAATQMVCGKLPFFSPRTPGNVLLRLYWHDDPARTLASGPAILVQVTEQDFDNSVRFILSNFKAKKTNPTSLSSLISLAQVLEAPLTLPNESAARALWGCIQESRKVIEVCNNEYSKTCSKMEELEFAVDGLKAQVEGDDAKSHTSGKAHDGVEDEAVTSLREKTRQLMSGRASNLRKWRDAQLAFASILRAAVNNSSMSILLRRDMMARLRVEYQLWCPLSEEFAIPNESSRLWSDALRDLPNNVSVDDFNAFAQCRTKMQLRNLQFEPNTYFLEDILYPRAATNQRSMDAGAVVILNNMSTAMGKFFRELYDDEERVTRIREMIRARAEQIVTASGAFPPGTRVVIFGSSANGFGSPNSDIDMSLILPSGFEFSKDDTSGSTAMERLATCLTAAGMQEVDAARLSARIPIIRFFCPNPLPSCPEDTKLIECDISMHNPLAVLNTSLLRTYAEITPITRVLAAIIKRWAKERDINNPSRHTLSSYGYILMLLHFLTFHKRNDKGLVVPIAPSEGDHNYRDKPDQQGRPLLPNLQWVDRTWPKQPPGTPYREAPAMSENLIPHPFEEGQTVNTLFYKPDTPTDKAFLQNIFHGQDLSLAILLASFFRYYAFEFDYRKCVVSLHSTATRGLVQREVKTEVDCWRNYSAALTIEDPFETFYDVAHVLRGGDYHRIRREFAVAYSKIADAAAGRPGSWNKVDLRNMSGDELLDWICEPVEEQERALHA